MRRTISISLLASLVALAACGSTSDDSGGAAAATTPATDAPADSAPADAEPDDTATGDTTPNEAADDDAPATTVEEIAPPPTSPDKPAVDLPDELPTELQTTVLVEGDGPEAELGDTVIVDYIGVRSTDGVEFDNSYDRFEPFPVALGTGSVIQGWEDGLIGARSGDRLQLDIPSDLAYGDQARGDVIGANEALTFVIDVRSVIKPADPSDAPTEAGVPESEGATEVTSVDLVDGDGAELEDGQTAVLHLVAFRGDNLTALDSTWPGEVIQIPMTEGNFPGLVEGMPGMRVGGRRAITIPPDKGFGPDGNPQMGLPAGVDLVIVVDLFGAY